MIDKNEIMTKFIKDCPTFDEYTMYFNYADENEDTIHYVTISDETKKSYVDGSISKIYQFGIIGYKAVSKDALVFNPTSGSVSLLPNANIEDMASMQTIIDWVNEQNENHNYPDFGEGYTIEEMTCASNEPALVGVTTDATGTPLAKYSIIIRLQYLDTTKMLWN